MPNFERTLLEGKHQNMIFSPGTSWTVCLAGIFISMISNISALIFFKWVGFEITPLHFLRSNGKAKKERRKDSNERQGEKRDRKEIWGRKERGKERG